MWMNTYLSYPVVGDGASNFSWEMVMEWRGCSSLSSQLLSVECRLYMNLQGAQCCVQHLHGLLGAVQQGPLEPAAPTHISTKTAGWAQRPDQASTCNGVRLLIKQNSLDLAG